MLAAIVRVLRGFAGVFAEEDAPRRLAFGFALGMMIGLVPKGNLTAALLGVILLASRANLVAGAAGAIVFSWVGMATDRLANALGQALLTPASLQPYWARLYELPTAPWFSFNNTAVLGNLLLGLVLFYPVYRLSRLGLERYRSRVVEKLSKYHAAKVLGHAETATGWRLR